jgi:putative ABC transport system substrate-binding protein
MRRRGLLSLAALFGGAWAGAARGQQNRSARIGVLSAFSARDWERYGPMIGVLRERGYVEGRNITFEYRFTEGDAALARRYAAELVAARVDLIVALATPAAHAAKDTTQTIPIVFTVADPLATGLVSNLARPGGNLTGVSTVATDLAVKQLELLREIFPAADRLAFLGSTQDPNAHTFLRQIETAGAQLGVGVRGMLIAGAGEFEAAFAAASAARTAAVIVQPIFVPNRVLIAELALRHRIAWIGDNREYAEAGALVAYGADRNALFRRMGVQIDRILRGAHPGELPVEQATHFQLIVNLRTARALGVDLPATVLARADEVIE